MVATDSGFFQTTSVRLHYMRAGSGAPIVFLHGFPDFWYVWRHQLAHFGTDHLALAPDLRGFNLSDKPAGVDAYKVKHLIADVLEFMDGFSSEPVTLVAHDWGGALAWSLAIAHPQRLARLVILNAPHPYIFWRELARSAQQQRASEYMLLLRSDKAERVLSENNYARLLAMRFRYFAPQAVPDGERSAYVDAWSQPGALTGSTNYYRASPLYPPSADDPGAARLQLLQKEFIVHVPTLVIWGMRDTALLPSNLDGLDEVVPQLRIERIPEGSHWVMTEQPDRVNGLIREFIHPPG